MLDNRVKMSRTRYNSSPMSFVSSEISANNDFLTVELSNIRNSLSASLHNLNSQGDKFKPKPL